MINFKKSAYILALSTASAFAQNPITDNHLNAQVA